MLLNDNLISKPLVSYIFLLNNWAVLGRDGTWVPFGSSVREPDRNATVQYPQFLFVGGGLM